MKYYFSTFFLLLIITATSQAQAPSYVDFEWDILRIGYAAPVGSENLSASVSYGSEIRYNVKDQFSIGIGVEANPFYINRTDGLDGTLRLASSVSIVGDYYLKGTSSHRSFLGLGLGRSANDKVTIVNDDIEEVIDGHTGFSLSPRLGYEYSHLRLLCSYHIGLKEGLTNYFSITAGITLFGGYRG